MSRPVCEVCMCLIDETGCGCNGQAEELMEIMENHEWNRGVWTVGVDGMMQEFIESSDFNHDVRLYLNGDFEADTQRINYLQHIADRLNAHPANLTDEEIEGDIVRFVVLGIDRAYFGTTNNGGGANLKAIWNGETGRLKSVEVLK